MFPFRKTLFSLAAATAIFAGPAHASPALQPVVLPMYYRPADAPYLVVRARIDGGRSLPFLVDTGSSTALLLDLRAARSLGLQPRGETIRVSPGDAKFTAVEIGALIFPNAGGELTLPVRQAFVGDLGDVNNTYGGEPLAGIIGAPLLAHYCWQLDFEARTMTLLPGDERLDFNPDAIRIPLRKRGDRYFLQASALSRPAERLLLDTGSPETSVPPRLAAELSPLAQSTAIFGGLGCDHVTQEMLVDSLSLGGTPVGRLVVDVAADGDVAQLGLKFLSRYRVLLDLAGGEMVLEPARRPGDGNPPADRALADLDPDPSICPAVGVTLQKIDQSPARILAVDGGSPAERSGLRGGDLIVRLNGRDTSDLSRDDLFDSLRKPRLTLLIRRGSSVMSLRLGDPDR